MPRTPNTTRDDLARHFTGCWGAGKALDLARAFAAAQAVLAPGDER